MTGFYHYTGLLLALKNVIKVVLEIILINIRTVERFNSIRFSSKRLKPLCSYTKHRIVWTRLALNEEYER